jgi:heparan-alpha-glucosaminide N-acetyltransferase
VCIHIWLPVRQEEHTPNSIAYGRSRFELYKKYLWHWLSALLLVGIYLLLTFATDVPGCGYGQLDQECNATGYWDRTIIGLNHMYAHPTLNRSPECSANSPGYEPIAGAPAWCTRPFDPEGIVGTFTACVTGVFGLFFGLVLANETKHARRLRHWMALSTVCMILGLVLHFSTAIPINKNLWSLSYVLVMVGVDGTVFSFSYWLVDMQGVKDAVWPLITMGMNAILVFVFAQSNINLDTFIQFFYIDQPTDNLYHWYQYSILAPNLGLDWGDFVWALTKVTAWFGISMVLHKFKIFWKL